MYMYYAILHEYANLRNEKRVRYNSIAHVARLALNFSGIRRRLPPRAKGRRSIRLGWSAPRIQRRNIDE
jgi:hypothetical protein